MRFIDLRSDEEINWSRVLLTVVAVGVTILVLGVALFTLVGAPHPEKSRIIVEEVSPDITPVWPAEVLALAPETVPVVANLEASLIPSFNETQTGVREIYQYFTIHRDNVSGNKDLTIKTTVYGWKEFRQVKWYSDGYGKYLDQFAPKGEKYVFVYLAEFIDGNTIEQDPRAWYFGPHLFRLQIDGRLYDQDSDFVPAVRIKDLEEIKGFNGVKGVRAFGYKIIQDRGSGNITAYEDPWLMMGRSNTKDGYLVYRVPENARDMMLVGSFGSWGQAAWRLT